MRSLASFALAAALTGCAFEPGDPWGVLDLEASVAFDPPAERLDDQGRLLTSSGFAVTLEELSVRVDAVSALVAPPEGALSFDPASPPPGYGLCHAGHCHADDGRLVPYAEIEAELGAASAAFTLTRPSHALLDLLGGATPVPLGACPAPECDLPRGTVTTVRFSLGELRVAGRAFDVSAAQRVPADGAPFEAVVPLGLPMSGSLDARLDGDLPPGLRLAATLQLTDRLLDGVDFARPLDTAARAERLATHSTVSLESTRFDP